MTKYITIGNYSLRYMPNSGVITIILPDAEDGQAAREMTATDLENILEVTKELNERN